MLFTLVLALLGTRLSTRCGLLDHPQGRKQHERPTPLCGGLVLWVMLSLLSGLGWIDLGLSRWDWLAIHAMALAGLLDDRFGMRARTKAIVGLSVALVLALAHGLPLLNLGGSFPILGPDIPNRSFITLPLLFLWFWFLPQAINLMDGVNGLVTGFSMLVLWFLGAPPLLLIPLAVILLFNYPKARLFLGDCGALMLGTLMAILTVKARLPHDPNGFFVLFIYPMVDVSTVVFNRWRSGRPLGQGDRGHLHHRVMDLMNRKAWLVSPVLLAFAFGLRILYQIGIGPSGLKVIGVVVFLIFSTRIASSPWLSGNEVPSGRLEMDPGGKAL